MESFSDRFWGGVVRSYNSIINGEERRMNMAKIGGKYEQPYTEKLLEEINKEDSITNRNHLISRYLHQRCEQLEKIIANIDNDDIDLALVVEQLWEDLQLAHKQISQTMK